MNTLHVLLKKLVSTPAISGYEWESGIAETIQDIIRQKSIRVSNNLVYKIGSGNIKILLSAHMDEVGFFISHVKNNYAMIMPIGDVDIEALNRKVLIFNDNRQWIKSEPILPGKSFSEIAVFGLGNLDVGTIGTFEKTYKSTTYTVTAPSLDNKVGCLALIEVLHFFMANRMKDVELLVCFTSREETGLNGIMSVARKFNPHLCIDIDSAYAKPLSDINTRKHWSVPSIGKGPAIQLMGNSFILSDLYRRIIEEVANAYSIPYQYEIPDGESGGTHAKVLLTAGYEIMQINIPVAFQHTDTSKASLLDIESTTRLLIKLLQSFDNHKYTIV